MHDFLEKFVDGDFHAKFFMDFTDKTLLKGFVLFAFATGEFPKSAQM